MAGMNSEAQARHDVLQHFSTENWRYHQSLAGYWEVICVSSTSFAALRQLKPHTDVSSHSTPGERLNSPRHQGTIPGSWTSRLTSKPANLVFTWSLRSMASHHLALRTQGSTRTDVGCGRIGGVEGAGKHFSLSHAIGLVVPRLKFIGYGVREPHNP